ncbi:tryptophan synthase subunit beta [Candidatus Woesearchaeota archaeon]|nr:tryptophan synthase subunit beta [Candidatus Woesearchaeota archaeon]
MKSKGKFGKYGGMFVPETLMPALEELEAAFNKYRNDKKFNRELNELLKDYAGRPTPLYFAKKFSAVCGCRVYLKREDLLHGGAHKTNNGLGQGLLAKYMGKKRLIAETGAGQHGFATALVGAYFGIPTEIYMGVEDIRRQHMNVLRMLVCGAKINPVSTGTGTLKEAINDALRDWITNIETTYYVFGTVAGPHPYPTIVKHFQKIIGKEARRQILRAEGRLPDAVVACVGGGSNAMGIFDAFRNDASVRLIGVEPGGKGINTPYHGASLTKGREGVFQGSLSYVLQNKEGQIQDTYSISAGLDYPGIGPEHPHLRDIRRAEYTTITDKEALAAFRLLSEVEGIIPALESAHAIAYAIKLGKKMKKSDIMVINLSGRGDKDMDHACNALGIKG